MIQTIFYALAALLALGFIIFLHELGHFLAALWMGMKVEIFSIGFGGPIKSWECKGVRWQIGWIPIGGYVSIKGMADDEHKDEADSYQQASPYKRMMVVAAGPAVNLVLAWVFFAGIWALNGQVRSFSETTGIIGWLDPQSELSRSVNVGDRILSYDGYDFHDAKDHLQAAQLAKDNLQVRIEKIDYEQNLTCGEYEYSVVPYPHPDSLDGQIKTIGILAPARHLFIEAFAPQLPSNSPLSSAAAQNDQIIAVNGLRVFSDRHLQNALNDEAVLLTVQRQGIVKQLRVATFYLRQLGFSNSQRAELKDWHYEQSLTRPIEECMMIAYDLSPEAVVQRAIPFIDGHDAQQWAGRVENLHVSDLMPGDRICAVNGLAIDSAQQLLAHLQSPPAAVVLYHQSQADTSLSPKQAERQLIERMSHVDLKTVMSRVGSGQKYSAGAFTLLAPVPVFERKQLHPGEYVAMQEKAKVIVQEQQKRAFESWAQRRAHEKVLGVVLKDQKVRYNPGPNALFANNFWQVCRSLSALVNAQLSPKWLVGPVGMVSVMAHGFSISGAEALYWLAIISLNLGMFNLLPLPIFDGGKILIDGFEWLTGKKINSRLFDSLAYIFVALLIILALTATYWDLWRLLTN